MSLSLPAGPWADDDGDIGAELGLIRWAAQEAGRLAGELTRLAADVRAAAQAIAGRRTRHDPDRQEVP